MKKVFLIIAILISNIAISQINKKDFETIHPKIKEVEVNSNNLEMGYQDINYKESDLVMYKVNGVFVKYNNEKWFIPFNRIYSIDSGEEVALIINLKEESYNMKWISD
jgi:hypothetical protein